MKNIFIALGMALILFVYGYLLSTAGHDHGAHHSGPPASESPGGHGHDH